MVPEVSARSWWRDGQHLGAASWAPVHPVRKYSHLWMSALASVTADGLRKGPYAEKSLQKCSAEHSLARVATGCGAAVRTELVHLTQRADERVRSGGKGVFHLGFLFLSSTVVTSVASFPGSAHPPNGGSFPNPHRLDTRTTLANFAHSSVQAKFT